jgi:HTH-type transcriptional regulator/antitoxin HigA
MKSNSKMGTYKVVGKNGQELRSKVILHPGEVLREELEARDIIKSAFAMELKIYPSHFSDLLKGRRNISAAIAIKLENALGISAEFWMRLQAEYDLKVERQKLQEV